MDDSAVTILHMTRHECCPPAAATAGHEFRSAPASLPTLQRNALRKIFGRAEFSPEEVAALGHRRLQQAEGIGSKGLSTIMSWLQAHGHALDQAPTPPARETPRKRCQDVEQAIRLLRRHGYTVYKPQP